MIELQKRLLTSLLLLMIIFSSLKNSIVLFFVFLAINYFSLIEINNLFKSIFKKKNQLYFFSFLASVIYISIFSLIIWNFLIPFNNNAIITLIFLILICISTDIGGFIFGKLVGGKKLTQISPNKTYSGVFGSFFLSITFGYFYYIFYKTYLIFEVNYLILIAIISLISQIGDLIISFLKRKAKIKDTGSILPGHGGILDRIDGILFALPFGIILISI
jgi:phosphatidate cytidylyltransferase|tara:strand:+ start:151 stop:804 length:654 start_codon:yes stop_codon:yes gene_type:complete